MTPGPWWKTGTGSLFKDFSAGPIAWMKANPPEAIAPRLTITEYAMIGELLRRGGLAKSSVWRVGQGARAKAAVIPPLAARFTRLGAHTLPDYVKDFFETAPRVKMVVAFFDLQYVRSLFTKATEHLLESVR